MNYTLNIIKVEDKTLHLKVWSTGEGDSAVPQGKCFAYLSILDAMSLAYQTKYSGIERPEDKMDFFGEEDSFRNKIENNPYWILYPLALNTLNDWGGIDDTDDLDYYDEDIEDSASLLEEIENESIKSKIANELDHVLKPSELILDVTVLEGEKVPDPSFDEEDEEYKDEEYFVDYKYLTITVADAKFLEQCKENVSWGIAWW